MFKDEILENDRRRIIYSTIKKNPGLHIRELQRVLNIPLASLQYHLTYLARRSIIVEEKSEHYTRYYCTPLDPKDKKILSILRQKTPRDIVLIILVSKKAKYRFLVDALKIPTSTVSFYLRSLVDNKIVERTKIGYENVYTIKDDDRITKILTAYQSSLLDRIVDKWANTWLENRFATEESEAAEEEQEEK
jgi:predicted transcriptional regulator